MSNLSQFTSGPIYKILPYEGATVDVHGVLSPNFGTSVFKGAMTAPSNAKLMRLTFQYEQENTDINHFTITTDGSTPNQANTNAIRISFDVINQTPQTRDIHLDGGETIKIAGTNSSSFVDGSGNGINLLHYNFYEVV